MIKSLCSVGFMSDASFKLTDLRIIISSQLKGNKIYVVASKDGYIINR